MPEEALTSRSNVFGRESGIVIEVKSRSRIEYIIPTNNIIVLVSYFNSTNKSTVNDSF